jgi:hypothetical protein
MSGDCFTTAPLRASTNISPEFIEPSMMKAMFGIGRTSTYQLINEGAIRSALIRRRGRVSGKRLIEVESVRSYLRRCVEESNQLRESHN